MTTDRPSNVVTVSADGIGGAALDVRSETGIGSAEVSWTSRRALDRIRLRFHLHGLEELRFSYDDATVVVSISSGPGNAVRESIVLASTGGPPAEIGPGDEHWMGVLVVDEDGKPATVPLTSGYIQVDVPKDFLTSGHRAFGIRWIDFYR